MKLFMLALVGLFSAPSAWAGEHDAEIVPLEAPGQTLREPHKGNMDVTDANFDGLVLKTKGLSVVKIDSNGCGRCVEMRPHWTKITNTPSLYNKNGETEAVAFFTLKYDDNPVTVKKYWRSPYLPYTFCFYDGKLISKVDAKGEVIPDYETGAYASPQWVSLIESCRSKARAKK